MKTWKKIVIVLSSLFVAIPLIIAGLFIYAAGDICGNEVYSEALSPDKKYKVVVFQRDCGATTGFSTQISIIDSTDDLKNESGNIYIIDGHPEDASLETNWLSNHELRIMRRLNGSEYKAELEWGFLNKIKVTYIAGDS